MLALNCWMCWADTINIGVLLSLGCWIRILAAVRRWVDISSRAASSPTAILNCLTYTGSVMVGSILCSQCGVWPTSYLCNENTSQFSIISSIYWSTLSLSIPEASNCDWRFDLVAKDGACFGLVFLVDPNLMPATRMKLVQIGLELLIYIPPGLVGSNLGDLLPR